MNDAIKLATTKEGRCGGGKTSQVIHDVLDGFFISRKLNYEINDIFFLVFLLLHWVGIGKKKSGVEENIWFHDLKRIEERKNPTNKV